MSVCEEPLSPNRGRLKLLVSQAHEIGRSKTATSKQIDKTEGMLATCARRQLALAMIQIRALEGAKRRTRLNESLQVVMISAADNLRLSEEERCGIRNFAGYVTKMNDRSEASKDELQELSGHLDTMALRLRSALQRRKMNLNYIVTQLEPRVLRALEKHHTIMKAARERLARDLRMETFMAETSQEVRDKSWLEKWMACCGFEGVQQPTVGIVVDLGSLNCSEKEIMVTPISFAACGENVDALQLLHAQGFDVNIQTTCGKTPMYIAAAGGRLKTMDVLLSLGGSVSLPDDQDETPLLRAVRTGKLEVAMWLEAHGARGDLRKPDTCAFNTPLHAACRMAPTSAALSTSKWLLGTSARKDLLVGREQTLLELFHNTAIVNRFFSRASSGRPCSAALEAGNFDVAELLVMHYGAWENETPFGRAVDAGRVRGDLQHWNQSEACLRSRAFAQHLQEKQYGLIEQFAVFLRCVIASPRSHALWKLSQLDAETSAGLKMKIASYTGLAFGRRLRLLHCALAAMEEFENSADSDDSSERSDDDDDDEDNDEIFDESDAEESDAEES